LHSSAKSIVSIGVKDTLIVSTDDAVLVADKNHLHKLDAVVKTLKAKGFDIAQNTPKVFTAWGNYEVLINTPNYKVKRIVIKPGGVLSLQRHKHRSEHWTVVKGALNVTIDEETIMIKPNASVYVPKNTVHRIANEGLIEGEIIEVQIGQYLEEDDIERIEDQYGRSGKYQKNNLPMNTGSTTNNLG
ncbi:MAG: cupin domain-containing protein, partial [Nitratireductor sp.]